MIPRRSLPYCGTGAAGAGPLPLGADGGARRSVRSSALPHHGGRGTCLATQHEAGATQRRPALGTASRGPQRRCVDRAADCCVDWRTVTSERSEQRAVRPRAHTTAHPPAVGCPAEADVAAQGAAPGPSGAARPGVPARVRQSQPPPGAPPRAAQTGRAASRAPWRGRYTAEAAARHGGRGDGAHSALNFLSVLHLPRQLLSRALSSSMRRDRNRLLPRRAREHDSLGAVIVASADAADCLPAQCAPSCCRVARNSRAQTGAIPCPSASSWRGLGASR